MNHTPGEILTHGPTKHQYIYALLDDDGEIFYVGRSGTPRERLKSHISRPTSSELRAKLASCSTPRMKILSGPLSDEVARKVEEICIQAGIMFLNVVNGETRTRDVRTASSSAEDYLRFSGTRKLW